ncbi:MAG: prepilin peptidase [Lachnospiraceae bacterium]|nr:prepilin peptidase [Lachnospiraceae bacterium]
MLLLRMMLGKLELWQWLLTAAVIIPCAIRDIRTKRINGYICLMGVLVALFIREMIIGEESGTILIDLIPGAVMYLIAFFSKERIGKGDALSLMFIGAVAGSSTVLMSLFVSLTIAAILSAILLALKKVKKDTKLPFIPFLSIGVIAGGLI